MLSHVVRHGNAYQRQGDDTIITWTDSSLGTDIALSFQEISGCNFVWQHIQDAQRSEHGRNGYGRSEVLEELYGEDRGASLVNISEEHSGMVGELDNISIVPEGNTNHFDDGSFVNPAGLSSKLPEPTLGNLKVIAQSLSDVSIFHKESIASQLLAPGYLSRLMSCINTARDLENREMLTYSYSIAKDILLLNDTALLETVFCEEYFWDLLGALEADPDMPEGSRVCHRDFLCGDGGPKEIIAIRDRNVRSKICCAHRMGYIKDVVLPRTLDDATFATLSSLQLFNNIDVLLSLHQDPDFFPSLFEKFWETDPLSEGFQDLVAYLQEILSLSRHLQANQRNALLQSLAQLGLFQVLTKILSLGKDSARLRAADILLSTVAHDSGSLRRFLLNDASGKILFGELVSSLHRPSSGGLQEQVAEVLRVLLDPDTLEDAVEKDGLLDIFYDGHISSLLDIIVASAPLTKKGHRSQGKHSATTLVLILELLCFCVAHHKYRIKYFVLRNNVVEKVLRLLHRREIVVASAALRFMRACVGTQDEFYYRYMVKNSLMEPVVIAFLRYHNRYNLFTSAVLELLEYISQKNCKSLIGAVVNSSSWTKLLEQSPHSDTLHKLLAKHEANEEEIISMNSRSVEAANAQNSSDSFKKSLNMGRQSMNASLAAQQRRAAAAEARKQRGEQEEDMDEEKYFNEDNDEEEHDALQGLSSDLDGISDDMTESNGLASRQVILEDSPSNISGLRSLLDYGEDDRDDTLPLPRSSKVHKLETEDSPKTKRGADASLSLPPIKKSKE